MAIPLQHNPKTVAVMMYKEVRIEEIPCISFLKGKVSNLYVGPELSWWSRRKLRKVECKHNIVYTPELFERISKEKFNYNFPGIPYPESLSIDNFYKTIREYVGNGITPQSICFIRYDGEAFVVYIGSDLNHAIAYLDVYGHTFKTADPYEHIRFRSVSDDIPEVESIVSVEDTSIETLVDECLTLEEKILENKVIENPSEEVEEKVDSDIRFSIRSEDEDEGRLMFSTRENKEDIYKRIRALEELSLPSDIRFRTVQPQTPPANSDTKFESEMIKAAAEVKKAIEALIMTGYPVEIIRSWLNETVKLSRVRITKQFKIILVDYQKEIKMGPLPKTVFLFYLRHPEGVRFSYLQDHIKELMHIYGRVSVNDDPQRMRESIHSLTNPLNNSICEKCAAIKKAFMLQMKNDIAQNYYVTGMQGGAKGITLDRNLVEWECEL